MRSSHLLRMTPVEAMALYSMLNKAGVNQSKSSRFFPKKIRHLPFYLMTIAGGVSGAIYAPTADANQVKKYNKDFGDFVARWPYEKYTGSVSSDFVIAQHNALRAAVFLFCGAGVGAAAGFLFVATAPITVPAYMLNNSLFDLQKSRHLVDTDQLVKRFKKIDLSNITAKFGGPWP